MQSHICAIIILTKIKEGKKCVMNTRVWCILPVNLIAVRGFIWFAFNNNSNKKWAEKEKEKWSTWNELFSVLVYNTWKTNKLRAILLLFFSSACILKREFLVAYLILPNMNQYISLKWIRKGRKRKKWQTESTNMKIYNEKTSKPQDVNLQHNQKHKCN